MAPGWRRRAEAGQDSPIGPRRVAQDGLGLARAGDDHRDDRGARAGRGRSGCRRGSARRRSRSKQPSWSCWVAAGRVEPDDLDQDRVEEVGHGRVVEREVAVLADPGADDVGRLGAEQVLVVQAGPQRPIGLLAGDQAEAVGRRGRRGGTGAPGGSGGTRRGGRRRARGTRPCGRPTTRDQSISVLGDQAGEELVLARGGGEDDVRPARPPPAARRSPARRPRRRPGPSRRGPRRRRPGANRR